MTGLMTRAEHRDIYQTISESIVTDVPPDPAPEEKKPKPEISPRALRGALYLDEHHPGWAKKINLETFDISSITDCVVGQIAGYYDCHAKDLFPSVGDGYNQDARDFGILPNGYNHGKLNHSWKILIAERQQ